LLGQKYYSLGVDIWAIGCIFAELIDKKAIFRGDSEIDQIFRIFQFLGTPTKENWPGCSQLPHFKASFPKFKKECLSNVLKNVDNEQL
jgi:serine/threonine protein kinase